MRNSLFKKIKIYLFAFRGILKKTLYGNIAADMRESAVFANGRMDFTIPAEKKQEEVLTSSCGNHFAGAPNGVRFTAGFCKTRSPRLSC